MKRILLGAVAIAAVLLLSSCMFSKTYYASSGTYYCMEVSTNDAELQSYLSDSTWKEGTCASAGFTGSSCSYTAYWNVTSTYTITQYWSDEYLNLLGANSLESYCDGAGYTYNP